jgi:hypothetical protein
LTFFFMILLSLVAVIMMVKKIGKEQEINNAQVRPKLAAISKWRTYDHAKVMNLSKMSRLTGGKAETSETERTGLDKTKGKKSKWKLSHHHIERASQHAKVEMVQHEAAKAKVAAISAIQFQQSRAQKRLEARLLLSRNKRQPVELNFEAGSER